MKRKNKKISKKVQNMLNKLSLFQKNDGKFSKNVHCQSKMLQLLTIKI